jgi:ribonucleotide monophosphatase NagD (HAD superfamily)
MLQHIKAIFFDLDGTVYFKGNIIPGAIETIKYLREKGYILRFLTNTDSKSIPTLYKQLQSYGLMVYEDAIYTPAVAAIN